MGLLVLGCQLAVCSPRLLALFALQHIRSHPASSALAGSIADRSRLDSVRRGMLEGFSLGHYLLLVDYTGRLFREGKVTISAELAGARLNPSI